MASRCTWIRGHRISKPRPRMTAARADPDRRLHGQLAGAEADQRSDSA
jgi:hypothetical protein